MFVRKDNKRRNFKITPSKYPEGILCWTKKNICEYNNNEEAE